VLKSDAKGKVVKGIQIGKYGRLSSCLIKEGKKALYMDDYRRDIRDRLRWQYDLHKDLQGKVPLPEVYDLFESNGDVYLVMELINGKVLHEKIVSLFNKDSWFHLPVEKKTRILDYLLSIIEIIDRLHRQQYVHRDITPVNFMVDPQDKLYVIDMELTYSLKSKKPEPPFRLGTIGFMSPEQVKAIRPTVKEDIYGLGATMISLFTGMSPSKFDLPVKKSLPDQQDLCGRLYYFLRNRLMAELIFQCLRYDPVLRPELNTIRSRVIQYKNEVIQYNNKEDNNENDDKQVNSEELTETIPIPYNKVPIDPTFLTGKVQSVLQALSGPELLGPDHLWFSYPSQKERLVINENLQSAYYPGLERGLSGVLFVLATAKKLGFTIDSCLPAYRNSWLYLQQHFLQHLPQMPPGLMTGAAGVATALTEGLEARLLTADTQSLFLIQQVLALPGTGIEVASGISGQGITLMKCSACLDPEFLQHQLEKYQEILISSQLKDGSWILPIDNNSKRGKKITGYAHGIAGIAYFLLRSYTFNHRETVLQAGIKALHWLEVNSRSGKVPTPGENTGLREETAYWILEPKSKETDPWAFNGSLSIAMVFIYAYDLLKDPSYRQNAEKALLLFPENLVEGNFSQASGLSGVGEVYLDAYRIFKEDKWYTRANWLAGLLLNVSKTSSNGGIYWQEDNYRTSSSADLLVGNSGILHFLMRLNQPEKLSHSLLLFNE
jgi:serine/threonine protein kinase